MDNGKWYDDDRLYQSGRDSDDSPLLSNRYEKQRRNEVYVAVRTEERSRRSTLTVLAKFFLFSAAMILFCVLMYIPVYNKANDQVTKGFNPETSDIQSTRLATRPRAQFNLSLVEGWSMHANRDTRIYVQPNNITTIHEPKHVCNKQQKNKLLLLIVVCSSTINFKERIAIRETWANYKNYKETYEVFKSVKRKYMNYNFTYDLYPQNVVNSSKGRVKRDISGFSRLLPALAEALQANMDNKTESPDMPEKRFSDEMLPEFDMNEEIGEQTEATYDYYDTNIMRIAPNGYETSPDLRKVLKILKRNKNFSKIKEIFKDNNTVPDFKVVFLLGLPVNDNDSRVQARIDVEAEKYGDVIQEGFIDSYNNLTLKSIMMLKWISNNCGNGVRYILKTDDDMFINVPNLVDSLQQRAKLFDKHVGNENTKELMLIGDLICGAKPVLDSTNKWFSPKYMYGGRVYPKYLSGTGYALSSDAAAAIYEAALNIHYFHLEDIFITGLAAGRAQPRVHPRDDPQFSYQPTRGAKLLCAVHERVTAHRVQPQAMYTLLKHLKSTQAQDECERIRLTQIKQRHRRLYVLYKFLRLLVTDEC